MGIKQSYHNTSCKMMNDRPTTIYCHGAYKMLSFTYSAYAYDDEWNIKGKSHGYTSEKAAVDSAMEDLETHLEIIKAFVNLNKKGI